MFVVTCWQVCISDVMVALVGKIHKDMQLVSSMQSGVHSFIRFLNLSVYVHAPSSVDHLFCISPFAVNCALAHIVMVS